jgi:hypothetical protein
MNNWKSTCAGLAFALLGAASAASAATFGFVSGLAGGGVTGTIETDGTLGQIGAGNIVNWNLVLNDGTNVFNLIGNGSVGDNSNVGSSGNVITATASALSFDFSSMAYLLFQAPDLGSGQTFVCLAGALCGAHTNAVNFLATPNFGTDIVSTAQSGVQVFAVATTAAVPLPAALPLFAVALGGLGAAARRKRRA